MLGQDDRLGEDNIVDRIRQDRIGYLEWNVGGYTLPLEIIYLLAMAA
jgi:hypothetical protein